MSLPKEGDSAALIYSVDGVLIPSTQSHGKVRTARFVAVLVGLWKAVFCKVLGERADERGETEVASRKVFLGSGPWTGSPQSRRGIRGCLPMEAVVSVKRRHGKN